MNAVAQMNQARRGVGHLRTVRLDDTGD